MFRMTFSKMNVAAVLATRSKKDISILNFNIAKGTTAVLRGCPMALFTQGTKLCIDEKETKEAFHLSSNHFKLIFVKMNCN